MRFIFGIIALTADLIKAVKEEIEVQFLHARDCSLHTDDVRHRCTCPRSSK